ncbi:MAG: DNA topoisomerase [Candidatus Pacearchaeota archaeon]
MLPKKKKSREEKASEEFFPINEDDLKTTTEKIQKENITKEDYLKNTIEKQIKEISKEDYLKTIVEKIYKKPNRKDLESVEKILDKKSKTNRKNNYKKTKNSKSSAIKEINFTPQEISLKEDGYELVITEKPQAALKIATALGKSTKRDINKIPYYEVSRDGKKIIVACAVGHLFSLKQKNGGSEIPEFNIGWFPNYLVRKGDFTKKYYDALLKLAKNAGSITIATDFDIEGEVIGLNVVRFITGQKDAYRMKFSTLTNDELNKSYDEKSPHLEWGQAIAGETRHYLDWFYGINLSRALMNAIKSTGRFKIMSIGRVQGPTLNLIVKKEKEIQAFKSEPYWQVFITVEDNLSTKIELKYIKDIFKKPELEKFKDLKGKTAIAETKKSQQKLPPNPPFNLTTLQTETYAFYGITPSRTLQIAQSLYLGGLISYPRTSSQKLPDSIAYKEILKKLSRKYNVEHLIKKQKPIEGKKTDPAHPSIYPTGNEQILSGEDEKIYNLIVKRFLSLFCEDAIIDNKTISAAISIQEDFSQLKGREFARDEGVDNQGVTVDSDSKIITSAGSSKGKGTENSEPKKEENVKNQKSENLIFNTRGSAITKKAWLEIYPSRLKEKEIPDMNGEVKIIDSKIENKETQPPHRYSPASIITELEKRNLGTKATRASILETLYDRGYIKEKSIQATPLGISLINTLEKYSPVIIDEALTRRFEKEMESIQESKKKEHLEEKEKRIIDEAKEKIIEIAKDFEKNNNKIGNELVEATDNLRQQEKEENKLIQCPSCKKGMLGIMYSPKTKRSFVGCGAYPECKKAFSLPPNGIIKKTEKVCEHCGFPMLMRLSKGKRPWIFCFNPECKTNKERIEKYKEKEEDSE